MAIGDNGKTLIDSEYPVLMVAASGRYTAGQISAGNYAVPTVTFASPITSVEPPLIFLNPDNAGVYQFLSLRGSPGNWTGFILDPRGNPYSGSNVSGRYMVGVFYNPTASGGWGMKLFDAAGTPLYHTESNIIHLTRLPTNTGWYPGGAGYYSAGAYFTGYRLAWTGNSEDYFLATSLIGGLQDSGASLLEAPAGFIPGQRGFIQGYSGTLLSTETGSAQTGRTVFAGRPARPL